MNFLAHSLFGFNSSELIAGQFCGDFVRGSDLSHFPVGVEQGIRLHRYLDRYTDTHPVLNSVRHNMPDVPRRLSGIVMDVMFDHHLALHWTQVSELSLESHEQRVLSALNQHKEHFPMSLKRFMQVLERENLLQNNVHLDSIELTLARIARRSPKFAALALNVEQLKPLRDTLVNPFNTFYPDLLAAASDHLSQSEFQGDSYSGSQGGLNSRRQTAGVAGNKKSTTP